MMKPTLLALIAGLSVSSAAWAQDHAAPPAKTVSNPTVELTFGMNGPQHLAAQFPGITASFAGLIPLGDRHGVGLVAEIDASYLRPANAAGVRVYKRGGSLSSGKHATAFAQILAGRAGEDTQGIFSSQGGRQLLAGIGITYGGLRKALHVEVAYRQIQGGRIDKKPPPVVTSEEFPPYRFVIGFTWRLRAR